MNNNEENNKHCDCCNLTFNLNSDFKRHIKTNKHLKNLLKLDDTKCPFCDYVDEYKSNLKRHINTKHKYNLKIVEKEVKKNKSTKKEDINILNSYKLLIQSKNILYWTISGMKSRYKMLLSRKYKPEEDIMINLKIELKQKIEEYNLKLTQIKELELLYPHIIQIDKKITLDGIDDNDDEDDDNDC